jgi:hypothetical protein
MSSQRWRPAILRREFDGNFAVCCGIHLDRIEEREIDILILSRGP